MQLGRPPKYSYLSHLLITVGVLLLSMFIFNAIGERLTLTFWDIKVSDLDFDMPRDLEMSEVYALKLSQLMFGLSFVFTAFIATRVFRYRLLSFTALDRGTLPVLVLSAVLLYVVFTPFATWLINVNAALEMPEKWESVFMKMESRSDNIYNALLQQNYGPHLFVNLMVMALLPAFAEEILFRGVLLRIFKSWTDNIHVGVLLTSLLFAALHFQPYKFLPMVMLSGLLCYVFYLTGSLWVPILIHFLNNALVIISQAIKDGGSAPEFLGDEFQFMEYIMIGSLVLTIILIRTLWMRSTKKIELHFE